MMGYVFRKSSLVTLAVLTGLVTLTAPASAARVAPHTTVVVPDVTGEATVFAQSDLQAVGLWVDDITIQYIFTCDDVGLVYTQTPAAGTVVATGSYVELRVFGNPPGHPC